MLRRMRMYLAVVPLATFIVALIVARASASFVTTKPEHLTAAAIGLETDTHTPCVDIACKAGDTCDCMVSVASPLGNPTGNPNNFYGPYFDAQIKTLNYELSMDDTVALDDGAAGGECSPATGNGVITLKDKSTINFAMSGLNCTVPGPADNGLFHGTIQLSGGTSHRGRVRGIGSIDIGDIGPVLLRFC